MTDYLTKEEIRQWRSSLERITLEEFAKRLGKEISNEKETNDMVDKVYKHSSEVRYVSNEEVSVSSNNIYRAERITSLAQQSFDREKEISLEKYEKELIKTINKNNKEAHAEKSLKSDKAAMKAIKAAVKAVDKVAEKKITRKAEKIEKEEKTITKKTVKAEIKTTKKAVKPAKKETMPISLEESQISFKKNLTPREQAVFEHFLSNKNKIVYAKELAQVLDLPRDYVYKYIKNLRAKMNENAIQNADNGGFVLTMS